MGEEFAFVLKSRRGTVMKQDISKDHSDIPRQINFRN
jgi:hypothetical protein